MFIGTSQETLDKIFLKQMDNYTQREVYAKIISLDWNERAIAEITGYIVSGNISVDGSSSTRRTCSLNLITDSINSKLNEIDWGLNTKFAVLIGLKNFIDNIHDDIIWFQQGVFIITSFTQTLNDQGLNISIQGKDKMCMLDGSIGGTLFADHNFSQIEVKNDDGTFYRELIPIHTLVQEAVHVYGLESYENIIISDLDDCAVELLDYKVKDRGMFIYDLSTSEDFTFYTSQMVFEGTELANRFSETAPKEDDYYIPYRVFKLDNIYYRIVKFVQYGDTAGYRETELTYPGDLVVNAGGSITQALDNIVNILGEFEYYYDIYGRFIFQRKRIYHNIAWTGAITNEGESTYYDSLNSTQSQYEFVNGFLISSFSNKPLLNNIRNDFVVWGTTTTEASIHLRYVIDTRPDEYTSLYNGKTYYSPDNWRFKWIGKRVYFEPGRNNGFQCADIKIDEQTFLTQIRKVLGPAVDLNGHYIFTYLLDEFGNHSWQYELPDRRTQESTLYGFIPPYESNPSYIGQDLVVTVDLNQLQFDTNNYQIVDWRELIYQMAYDNSRAQSYIQQFSYAMNDNRGLRPYKKGYTPAAKDCYYWDIDHKKFTIPKEEKLQELVKRGSLLFGIPNTENINLFMTSTYVELIQKWQDTWNSGYDYCYADLLAFWRLIYDNRSIAEIELDVNLVESDKQDRIKRHAEWEANNWWNPDIIYCDMKLDDEGRYISPTLQFKDPGKLLFWFDIIGENSELDKYRMSLIGRRPKVVNDNDVKAIFFRDTPEVLFIDPTNSEPKESMIHYVKLNLVGGLLNYFQVSGQGKSAKEMLDNMVYDYTYYQEGITITSLPVYYLEPNVRISVSDDTSGIRGEYFIKSFNYSFAHDGTMSITATKAVDRIL